MACVDRLDANTLRALLDLCRPIHLPTIVQLSVVSQSLVLVAACGTSPCATNKRRQFREASFCSEAMLPRLSTLPRFFEEMIFRNAHDAIVVFKTAFPLRVVAHRFLLGLREFP